MNDDQWGMLKGLSQAPQPETGFMENLQVGVGQAIDEGLLFSEYIHEAPKRERNDQVLKMLESGEIDQQLASPFIHPGRHGARYDWDHLADLAKEVNPEIKMDDELEAEMTSELDMRREYAQDVTSRAGVAGTAGELIGGMVGTSMDPALWPGFAFGPSGAVAASTALRAFGYGALRVGTFTAAEETLIQAQVMDWKERIGVDYGYTDAAVAIGGAAVLGGTVGGFVGTLNKILDGSNLPDVTRDAHKRWAESEEGSAATKTIVQMRKEMEDAPSQDMPLEEFTSGMQSTEDLINAPVTPARTFDEVMDETKDEVVDAAIDEQVFPQIADEAVVEPEIPDMPIPREDGTMGSLRQDLEQIDAEEQRLLSLRDCLVGG